MNSYWKMIAAMIAAILLFSSCTASSDGPRGGQTLTHEQAAEQVRAYVQTGKVRYSEVSHAPDDSWVGVDTMAEDLPEIDKYPLSVRGGGSIDVEIFSSTEKSNAKQDRWLDTMARQFNESGATLNGQRVSVSVRPIASGLALNYITSRKYIPGAYSPSNELWAAMIDSIGVRTQLVERRLTGNTAGILMKKDTYSNFVQKYGNVNIDNVVAAVLAGDLKLGHTDPNQSSTGLNVLTEELLALDSSNPVSDLATQAFKEFQAKVPPTSPTTDEMSKVAAKGLMDAMIMESQAFAAEPKLATDWAFTPAGVRHDSPLYALDSLSDSQVEVLRQFAKFSLSAKAQESASSYGFNLHNDYVGKENHLSGAQLFSILDVWKQNKDAGVPVVSVFVVDRSGSMDGAKLNRAKQALRSSAGYINPGNHVGLVSYAGSGNVTVDLPIGQFDDRQRSKFVGAVNNLQAGGDTATNDALVVALKLMLDAQGNLGGDVKLRVIVMSDGQQNAGLGLRQAADVVAGLRVPVYGVGFEADLSDLDALAQLNEGYVINADREDGPAKLNALVRGAL